MNFRKIYECGLTYEKGNDGPFDEWKTSLDKSKELKPEIRGTPHFDYEVAPESQNNKPSCPYTYDTYEAKYSKTGSLTESMYDEVFDEEYDFDPADKEFRFEKDFEKFGDHGHDDYSDDIDLDGDEFYDDFEEENYSDHEDDKYDLDLDGDEFYDKYDEFGNPVEEEIYDDEFDLED
jgi:hypothetical protein